MYFCSPKNNTSLKFTTERITNQSNDSGKQLHSKDIKENAFTLTHHYNHEKEDSIFFTDIFTDNDAICDVMPQSFPKFCIGG